MLREQSQTSGRKIADLAAAIVDAHMLLVAPEAEVEAGPFQESGPAVTV